MKSQVYPKNVMDTWEGVGRGSLSKTHVISTILVILDISCMFVTMGTDSARNPVCWTLGSSLVAMWWQFGPLGAFWSMSVFPGSGLSVSPSLSLSLSFPSLLWDSPFLPSGNSCFQVI